MNEMKSFTVSNINITSGDSVSPEITPKYQDEDKTGFYFTDPSTFRYTSDTKNADGEYIVRINNVQGIIIGSFAGKAKVVAEHIPSGLTSEFWVTVTTPAGSVIPDNIPIQIYTIWAADIFTFRMTICPDMVKQAKCRKCCNRAVLMDMRN